MRPLSFLLAALLLFIVPAGRAASEPSIQTTFEHLISATIANDHGAFVAECDATMKAALTKEKLAQVSQTVGARARTGYDANYLGALKQRGFQVHLWQIIFKDGGDDLLASMSVKDGKVGGFYLN